MNNLHILPLVFIFVALLSGCKNAPPPDQENKTSSEAIQSAVITEKVGHDSDDPAIWINKEDLSKSLVLGTDKGDDGKEGAVYVFDLNGRIDTSKTIKGLRRPNNIDIEYGFVFGEDSIDIAVVTERNAKAIRVIRLPEMEMIDGGGIAVFEGIQDEEQSSPMGISLYKRGYDGAVFAIVSRKNGPTDGTYLWQYRLSAREGKVVGEKVREFGAFSGKNEIEAIAVDDGMGYVYYSDEGFGIRKYHADPDSGNAELASFGQEGFAEDHEGIGIFAAGEKKGFILVSDQQANSFRIFSRYGCENDPHHHHYIKSVEMDLKESDGCEITAVSLNSDFSKGLFVAMSDDATFRYFKIDDVLGDLLE